MAVRPNPRRLVAVLIATALFLAACASSDGGRGPLGSASSGLTPPPSSLPAASDASALLGGAAATRAGEDPNLDLGDALFVFGRTASDLRRLDLPLFDAPGGRHWGWLTQGRVWDQDRKLATGAVDDVILALPDRAGLSVLARGEGDWIKVRVAGREAPKGGEAWTRAREARNVRAVVEPWAEVFAGAAGLTYRSPEVNYNLRAGPSTNSAAAERISGRGYDLAVLEIQGEWMRVRWSRPPACAKPAAEDALLGGAPQESAEGWIKWISPERGPWVLPARDAARCGRVS